MTQDNKAVEIGSYFEQFISKQVASGRFGSDAEVLQAGLRLLEEKMLQFHLQQSELVSKHDRSEKDLEALTHETSEISHSMADAMRALASSAAPAGPVIPTTKGLLRSQIAAE
ncbi:MULTISPECIES: type II toxin-antitoxin system ParD family antitoxin [Cohaesibacter]|uniref:type II toxin-antitoxin system ParD family antitoxin n=1 Tax=Cohaesibacter TaxID=655352 RepID=UPI0018E5147F|nr:MULTISPECIES: type II toxin-antitoxin system ParD family antitoxin [Cohaesibacter]